MALFDPRISRRKALLGSAMIAVDMLRTRLGRADSVTVPIPLQAKLLAKVASYDKNLRSRAGEKLHILLVPKSGNPESSHAVAQMLAALGSIGDIDGLTHDEAIIPYTNPKGLAAACASRRAAIVFLGPGFGREIAAISEALDGVSILSASAVADDVGKGIVLGFDLVSSNPKLLVHLTQARKQHVAFRADVLKLMKVFE